MKNRVLARWRTGSLFSLGCLFLGLLLGQAPTTALAADPADKGPADKVAATNLGKSNSLAAAMPSGAVGFAEVSRLGDLLKRI